MHGTSEQGQGGAAGLDHTGSLSHAEIHAHTGPQQISGTTNGRSVALSALAAPYQQPQAPYQQQPAMSSQQHRCAQSHSTIAQQQ